MTILNLRRSFMDNLQKDPNYILADVPSMIEKPALRKVYTVIRGPFEWVTGISRMNRMHTYLSTQSVDAMDLTLRAQRLLNTHVTLPSAEEIEPYKKIEGPLIIASNHPIAGHEFMVMLPLFYAIRQDFKILVNPFLTRIRELSPLFIPIDPYETEESSRKNMIQMRNIFYYLRKGGMIHLFPAGEVSSLKVSSMKISDKPWNDNIFSLAMKIRATIVPLYFHGRVSNMFQFIGLFPKIRPIFLPRELTRQVNRELQYKLGRIITPDEVASFSDAADLTKLVREETYKLRNLIKPK